MANLVEVWEELFVRGEGLAQVTSPIMMPEAVFKASGHLDKFTDYTVKVRQK